MRILRVLLIVVIFPFFVKGQTSTAFFKVYSSGNFDIGEGVCQLADSSYFVTGSSGGFQTSSPQAFVMKVDKEGKQLWTVAKGGEEAETGRRIFYLNDTLYVWGRTNSYGNSYDYYFLKLDTLGNTIQEKAIGSTDFEWLQDAVFMPKDSTFILYGYRQETQGFKKFRQITKLTRTGMVLWQKEREVHFDTRFKSMHLINDSVFGIAGNDYRANLNVFDALFLSFDYQGSMKDSIRYNNTASRSFFFSDFSVSSANRLKLVGGMYYTPAAGEKGDPRIWNFRMGVDTLIWVGGELSDNYHTSFEYIVGNRFDPKKYFFIESAYSSNFQTYSDGMLDESLLHIFFDNEAYYLNGITNVSAAGNDVPNQAISTLDGGMIVVGYNEYFGNGAQNVTLLKTGANSEAPAANSLPGEESLVSVKNIKETISFSIYPNPVQDKLLVDVVDFQQAEITDVYGKIIIQTNSSIVDVSSLANGVYILKVQAGNSIGVKRFTKK